MRTFLQRHTPSLGGWAIIVSLTAMLALAVGFVVNYLASFPASGNDGASDVAFTFGALVTLAVGVGLMALIFYSSRRGYDEQPQFRPAKHDES